MALRDHWFKPFTVQMGKLRSTQGQRLAQDLSGWKWQDVRDWWSGFVIFAPRDFRTGLELPRG